MYKIVKLNGVRYIFLFTVFLVFASFGIHFVFTGHAATTAIQGDINSDGVVNIQDLSLLLSSWGQTASVCTTATQYTCDLNGDGKIDIYDLSILLSHFGMTGGTGGPSLYEGADVDMCNIDPQSNYYIKNGNGQDLIDVAHHLGINMVRIVSNCWASPSGSPPTHTGSNPYSASEWQTVLHKLNSYGMKAIVTFEPYNSTQAGNENAILEPGYHTELMQFLCALTSAATPCAIYSSQPAPGPYPNDYTTAVYALDMINEPQLDNNLGTTSNNLYILNQEAPYVRNTGMKVTIGGWKTTEQPKSAGGPCANVDYGGGFCWQSPADVAYTTNGISVNSISDVIEPHLYYYSYTTGSSTCSTPYGTCYTGPFNDPYTVTSDYFTTLLNNMYCGGATCPSGTTYSKPVVVGEYGAANGDAISDQQNLASQIRQAYTVNGVTQAVHSYQSKNVIGSNLWALFQRQPYYTNVGAQAGYEGTQGMDVVKFGDYGGSIGGFNLTYNGYGTWNGYTIYEGGYVIQKDMTGSSDVPLNLTISLTPNAAPANDSITDYIFTTGNGGTQSVHVGDILGFKLSSLSTSDKYTVSYNSALFNQTAPLMNEYGIMTTVLRANAAGSGTITIHDTTTNTSPYSISITIL